MEKNKEILNVYLSGKIAGLQEDIYKANFAAATMKACDLFPDKRLNIINPATLPAIHKTWADYLIRDLTILKDCDAIVMLPNWRESKGAMTEHAFAEGCGITIKYL